MMSEFLWQAFVTLFVIIDPIALVPIFVGLTQNDTLEYRRRTALKASVIAAILLFSFAFIGDKLLDAMSISEPAFRIAGGFLLLIAAIEMVMARQSGGMHSTTPDENEETAHREDISVFPLAIPLLAGPGALTSVVVLMRQAEEMSMTAQGGVLGILVFVLLISYLSLLAGERILRLLGVTGTHVLTRVFGIILAALATQHIINGIRILFFEFTGVSQ